jgi:hypothetical protein
VLAAIRLVNRIGRGQPVWRSFAEIVHTAPIVPAPPN